MKSHGQLLTQLFRHRSPIPAESKTVLKDGYKASPTPTTRSNSLDRVESSRMASIETQVRKNFYPLMAARIKASRDAIRQRGEVVIRPPNSTVKQPSRANVVRLRDTSVREVLQSSISASDKRDDEEDAFGQAADRVALHAESFLIRRRMVQRRRCSPESKLESPL